MENKFPNVETPKKKLKWYWWIVIILSGQFIIGSLISGNDKKAVTEESLDTLIDSKDAVEQPSLSTKDVDNILKGLRVSKDEFKKTSFYHDPNSTKYDNINSVYLYLGRDEKNNVWPRLRIQYAGEDWLFVEAFRFVIDGGSTKTILPTDGIKKDNDGGEVWEVCDKSPDSADLLTLNEIANSKVAKIRYEGREKVRDRVITEKEKKSLKKMLKVYNNFK